MHRATSSEVTWRRGLVGAAGFGYRVYRLHGLRNEPNGKRTCPCCSFLFKSLACRSLRGTLVSFATDALTLPEILHPPRLLSLGSLSLLVGAGFRSSTMGSISGLTSAQMDFDPIRCACAKKTEVGSSKLSVFKLHGLTGSKPCELSISPVLFPVCQKLAETGEMTHRGLLPPRPQIFALAKLVAAIRPPIRHILQRSCNAAWTETRTRKLGMLRPSMAALDNIGACAEATV